MVRVGDLVAAPNSTHRSVVAADGDSAAVAASVTAIPGTVVVAVPVTVVPHSHTANGGIDKTCAEAGTTGVAIAIALTANKPSNIVRMNGTSLVVDVYV